MIVLTTSTTMQEFKVTPRGGFFDTLVILDELEGVETTIPILSSTEFEYYYTIQAEFELKENRFYVLKLYSGSNLLFYDKIYCTDQTPQDYKILKDEFIEPSTDNEFIFYE
jgi:hypothetical protein